MNVMDIWVASGPTREFIVYISGFFPTDEYFLLGSYGADGLVGGDGFAKDITWHSLRYPHFQ